MVRALKGQSEGSAGVYGANGMQLMRDLTSNEAPKTPATPAPCLCAKTLYQMRPGTQRYIVNDEGAGAVAIYKLNERKRSTI